MRTLLVFAAFAFQTAPSSAQDDERARETLFSWSGPTGVTPGDRPMATDRPDFTEASTTVGLGVTQVEFGYTFSKSGGAEAHSLGEPLLRHGVLATWLELRLAVSPVAHREDRTTTGTEDLYLGAKFALAAQHGALPETALVLQMTVPTGSAAFTADRALAGANLLYGWDLDERWSVAGSTQVNRAAGRESSSYDEWAQSVTVARALSGRVGSYAEWFGIFDGDSDQHYLNGGLTLAATDDLQFDVRLGKGLNTGAEDLFVGTGVSVRFR